MILIRKVADPFGWLGNMSPFPIVWDDKEFRTSEAVFQAMRFDDEAVREAIRAEKSPMGCKFCAKKHKALWVVKPCGEQDLDNMRLCLRLKIEQHPDLHQQLLETGNEEIVEDCTKRQRGSGLFWGAADRDGEWVGENWLGKLWMELRQSISEVGPQRCVEVD